VRLHKSKVAGPCPVPPTVTVSDDLFTSYVFPVAPKNDRLLRSGGLPLWRHPPEDVERPVHSG
jgi:hypothetical protein